MRVFPLSNSIITDGPTDGRTNGPTDQRTDKASYRVACPQLKTNKLKKKDVQKEKEDAEERRGTKGIKRTIIVFHFYFA